MPPISVQALFRRLGKPAPLEGDELGRAEAAVEDAFALVQAHGHPVWTVERHPKAITALVLAIAERKFRNPEGLVQEQAGEVSYRMGENTPQGLTLTRGELLLIQKVSGRAGLKSVSVQRDVLVGNPTSYPYPNPSDSWGLT
ncbi:hypothetical protein [Kitasatospora purpeofusca]|uniref:hypothetical protein n=1 Tax=Kitasatospora purpeofusca TaxID=67352 RepID=UPI0036D1A7E3